MNDQEQSVTPITSEQPALDKPTQPAVVIPIQQPNVGNVNTTSKNPKKNKTPWLIPAIIGGFFLVIGGGAYGYMGIYMHMPQNIWKSAVRNTGNALTAYIDTPQASQGGGNINGTLSVTAPAPIDASLTGAYDEKNATYSLDAGALGVRINADIRSITADKATSPDIYIKVDGLKSLSSLLGAISKNNNLLNEVGSNWYFIDRTLTAQVYKQTGGEPLSAQSLNKDTQEIAKKVNVVFRDYIFTTNQDKSVVVVKESLGKEDFKGRQAQKYAAQVRKQQLKDMVGALNNALKDTKAKELVVYNTSTALEQQLEYDQLAKKIDSFSDDKLVAEVWVDTGLRYIRNVRVALPTNNDSSTDTLDFTLDYTGGDAIPLSITLTLKDKTNDVRATLGVTLHRNNANLEVGFDVDGTTSNQKIKGSLKIAIEPTNNAIKVTKPEGAKNILELAGGVLGVNTQDSAPTSGTIPNLLKSLF
ncbi:hypothetical protein EB118_08670 [bacterium]|nr:hypothetical protein [bacterium]NBX98595.1 hypothetical protein [bacterium]NDC94688.1 hypothetical protein [bacterium]NDD84218.1 hypothetical protein [bacterium]NDG30135.1 hypothetical protein [bacterium]